MPTERVKKFVDSLKDFDAYPKPFEDLQEKTFVGGAVTMVCRITIGYLLITRCYEYFTSNEATQAIFVDVSRGPKLWINFDIVFHAVSCSYLFIDAMDSSGEQHLHIEHNIFKRKLDLNGNPLQEPEKEEIKTTKKPETAVSTTPECGSCYGAENPALNITCCNTCDELRTAYQLKRWHLKEADVKQCSDRVKKIENAFKEGCQLYGNMEVNRVGGSFHIGPGDSVSFENVHLHLIEPFTTSSFNTSHHIRHLSFGKSKVTGDVTLSPLDGTLSIDTAGGTMFHYYITLVPTLYARQDGSTLQTNQFSALKNVKVPPNSIGMPGVFFSYEISALMVKITEKRVPLSHLLTDLCSSIGGVWVVCKLIDSFIYSSTKTLMKMELGKAS